MKLILLISSFLFAQAGLGQYSKDTLISKRTLDSLKSELWKKSETINRMSWAYSVKGNIAKIDTTLITKDSLVINHRSKDNKILYQESINLRKSSFGQDYCKGLIVNRFFNSEGQPIFIEYWHGLCYEKKGVDEDVKYFDAKLKQIERIIYNKAGQIIKRLVLEYPIYDRRPVYEFSYSYDNGNETQSIEKVDKNSFWN